MINERWIPHDDAVPVEAGDGVTRRVLAYDATMMCVENTFAADAVGPVHQHPHTQITYVVSGVFDFEIDGVIKTVRAGDSMLKTSNVPHGCVCREAGVLLDLFTPMREDLVAD